MATRRKCVDMPVCTAFHDDYAEASLRVCGRVQRVLENRIKSKRITGRAGAKVRVCDECWNMLAPSHMQRRSSLERAMDTNAMAAGMTSGDTPASTPAGTRRAGQTKSTSHAVPPRSETPASS